MNLEFKPLEAESMDEIRKYSSLRPIYESEGQFMNQFIWAGYYNTEYHCNDRYLFYKMNISNEIATMMPMCKQEDLVDAFWEIKDYFNNELKQPLKMYLIDKNMLETLQQSDRFLAEFDFVEDRSCFDYMYDANKLKTLSGRAYHKKKNHLNSFLKAYDGRYKYKTLVCSDMDEIKTFHQEWLDAKKVIERQNTITSEEDGVYRIFNNCSILDCRLGGIYIDDKLEAYSIGSYNPDLKCAFIHVEKANVTMKGLYNYINQQFLINCFPDAELVNREDDLGQEGLRKAKLSYNPIELIEKYNLTEKQ